MPELETTDPTKPVAQPPPDELLKKAEGVLAQHEDVTKQQQEVLKQQQEATKPGREEARTALKQQAELLQQPLPELPNIPPPPMAPPMSKDTANMMGSIGMLIAGLGGFGSRKVGMAMNSAATGLLRGFREGRYDETLLAAQQWKNLFDYQMTQYDMRIRNRQAILQQSGMSIENKLAQIQLDEAPFMDQQQLLANQEKGLEGELKYLGELTRIRETLAMQGMKVNTELELLPKRIELMNAQIGAANARAQASLTGKAGSPVERRQELSRLLSSYEKERDRIQKQVDAYHWTDPPPELMKSLNEAESQVKATRKELEGGVSPSKPLSAAPTMPTGGVKMPGKTLVKRKSDGQMGIISDQYFDPTKYEKVQ